MPYAYLTLAQARAALAARLLDPGNVFWSATELNLLIVEALRTWNALTGVWQDDMSAPISPASPAWLSISDNSTFPNNLRDYTLTDDYLYKLIQLHLLEPATGAGTWSGTSQYQLSDFTSALQRRQDEMVQLIAGNLSQLPPVAISGRRALLPDSVLDVRRARFLPNPSVQGPGTPYNFSDNFLPPRTLPLGPGYIADPANGYIFGAQGLQQPVPGVGPSWITLLAGPNQTGQTAHLVLSSFNTGISNFSVGLFGRFQGTPGSPIAYYEVGLSSSSPQAAIYKFVGGVVTVLRSQAGIAIPANSTLSIQIIGTVIKLLLNGVTILTATDAAIANGTTGFITTGPPLAAFTSTALVSVPANPQTLGRADAASFRMFSPGYLQSPQMPRNYSLSNQPPLTLDVDFPPNVGGSLDLITIKSSPAPNPPDAVPLVIPDDWAWVLKWGVLGDLLGRVSEAQDTVRANYALARYQEGIQLAQALPWLIQASLNNVPCAITSLVSKDQYDPGWETPALNPSPRPGIVVAGLDLLSVSPRPTVNTLGLTLRVVTSAPVPATDGSGDGTFIQASRDTWDDILDYAVHLAMFKCGGQEFADTMALFDNFRKSAQLTNQRLANLGLFDDFMKREGQRQTEADPRFAGPSPPSPIPVSVVSSGGGAGGD